MRVKPWNNWFHCNGSTYGAWLRGDPRGWRSRWHHEHVEGDYKKPPPKGKFQKELEQSKALMKRPAVVLSSEARKVAIKAMIEALLHHHVELVAISVGGKHWHALARFLPIDPKKRTEIQVNSVSKNRMPRHLIGIAKKHAAKAMSDAGLLPRGGVWAVRGGVKPIKDRAHQVNVLKYIRDHAHEGAEVWTMFDSKSP
jgi:hypothetical protein